MLTISLERSKFRINSDSLSWSKWIFTTGKSPQGLEVVFPTEVEFTEIILLPRHHSGLNSGYGFACGQYGLDCVKRYILNKSWRISIERKFKTYLIILFDIS